MERKSKVILYSKPGCHLCDEMKAEILRADCSELYTLHVVNIESDPDLFAQYRHEIPVLSINGVEVFKHRLRSEEFRARLTAGGGKPTFQT